MKNVIVSKAEFARVVGVSAPAVTKAIAAGRIKTLANGRIDLESARTAWIANTDPERGKLNLGRRRGVARRRVSKPQKMLCPTQP